MSKRAADALGLGYGDSEDEGSSSGDEMDANGSLDQGRQGQVGSSDDEGIGIEKLASVANASKPEKDVQDPQNVEGV